MQEPRRLSASPVSGRPGSCGGERRVPKIDCGSLVPKRRLSTMRATAVALTLALVAPVWAADDEVVKVKPEQVYIDLTLTRRLPPAQRPAAEKQVYDTAEKVWKK